VTSPFFDHRVPALLAEVVEMYKGAGRRHGGLGDDELAAEFQAAFEAYAAAQGDREQSRRLNDVAAEHVLRRRDAPLKLVAGRLVSVVSIPGYEKKLPAVLLAFGRVMCIPFLGMVVMLHDEDEWSEASRKRRAAEQADFRWLLGLPAERAA
jgi:hypothetical protein